MIVLLRRPHRLLTRTLLWKTGACLGHHFLILIMVRPPISADLCQTATDSVLPCTFASTRTCLWTAWTMLEFMAFCWRLHLISTRRHLPSLSLILCVLHWPTFAIGSNPVAVPPTCIGKAEALQMLQGHLGFAKMMHVTLPSPLRQEIASLKRHSRTHCIPWWASVISNQ